MEKIIGKKRSSSGASSMSDTVFKWDRSHSEVGDTLQYFNAFHSSRSWCCFSEETTNNGGYEWLERDLLVNRLFVGLFLMHNNVEFTFTYTFNNYVENLSLPCALIFVPFSLSTLSGIFISRNVSISLKQYP